MRVLFQRRTEGRTLVPRLRKNGDLQPPNQEPQSFGKAPACTLLSGSMTVECALILPLFLLGILTVISFMEIYGLQTERLSALCDRAKEVGIYAHWGEETEEISLPDWYSYESPFALLPLPPVRMRNQVRVHPWTGFGGTAGGEGEEGGMVYVTEHGGVYHEDSGCRHLKLSIQRESKRKLEALRNRYGEKYRECERCWENGGTLSSFIYITDTGNRYHSRAGCSGLRRTVRLVKRSRAQRLPPCKTCGGGGG